MTLHLPKQTGLYQYSISCAQHTPAEVPPLMSDSVTPNGQTITEIPEPSSFSAPLEIMGTSTTQQPNSVHKSSAPAIFLIVVGILLVLVVPCSINVCRLKSSSERPIIFIDTLYVCRLKSSAPRVPILPSLQCTQPRSEPVVELGGAEADGDGFPTSSEEHVVDGV